jgi:transketolase
MAAAARLDKKKHRVYVMMGDGEINAGGVWEAAMFAAKYRIDNLTAILDYNGVQQTGTTADVMSTEPIADKWRSFGWHVIEIHAHNVRQILEALDLSTDIHARPCIIIARGTKGKGVSFMEYNNIWHGKPPTEQEYLAARAELERGLAEWPR